MSPERVALIAHDNKKKELIEWVKLILRACENAKYMRQEQPGRE